MDAGWVAVLIHQPVKNGHTEYFKPNFGLRTEELDFTNQEIHVSCCLLYSYKTAHTPCTYLKWIQTKPLYHSILNKPNTTFKTASTPRNHVKDTTMKTSANILMPFPDSFINIVSNIEIWWHLFTGTVPKWVKIRYKTAKQSDKLHSPPRLSWFSEASMRIMKVAGTVMVSRVSSRSASLRCVIWM